MKDEMTENGIVSGIESDPITLNGHKHKFEESGVSSLTGMIFYECIYDNCRAIKRETPCED